jgi:hypothetical protein
MGLLRKKSFKNKYKIHQKSKYDEQQTENKIL